MSNALESSIKHTGLGPLIHGQGVAFRVWAPHAEKVWLMGTFNDWNSESLPLEKEEQGTWYGNVPQAKPGDEYRYRLLSKGKDFTRVDPYARQVTNSVGNGVIHEPNFDWQGDQFQLPTLNELVVYELHIGSFHVVREGHVGTFRTAEAELKYLKALGVNVVEIMPSGEFAGDFSWGYNPAHIFAVESSYGGPQALKRFVKAAHQLGIGVILDVVYNHFGPSDLNLWQFDGWGENEKGGIYFYNDWRSTTPWGDTRPDYGRGEVRQFIRDNALMWLNDYHVDGLRYDMTLYMRHVRGDDDPGAELPEGWSLVQWINSEIRQQLPNRITIAEDLRNNEAITESPGLGGAGFHSQWDARFVHPVRQAMITPDDKDRSMLAIRDALLARFNGDAFRRVIYSESHDEVANGKARVTTEVSPDDPQGFFARKRSVLAASLVFTAPGVPMIFQGQEFLQDEWFRDDHPLKWELKNEYPGIVQTYRDLIALRLNRTGVSRGLSGQGIHVFHVNDEKKVLAFQRFHEGGPADDVVVVVNLANQTHEGYRIGFPSAGKWKLRFNSDSKVYCADYGAISSEEVATEELGYDEFVQSAEIAIGPYATLIFSQDAV